MSYKIALAILRNMDYESVVTWSKQSADPTARNAAHKVLKERMHDEPDFDYEG
jgi:hypothetical protein